MREWKKIEELKDLFEKDEVLAIIWTADDIRGYALSIERDITPDEAKAILDLLDDHHDTDYGITWDSVRDAIEDVIDSRPPDDELADLSPNMRNTVMLMGRGNGASLYRRRADGWSTVGKTRDDEQQRVNGVTFDAMLAARLLQYTAQDETIDRYDLSATGLRIARQLLQEGE